MKTLPLPVISLILTIGLIFQSCQKQVDYTPQINSLQSSVNALQKRCDSLAGALAQSNSTITSLSAEIITLTTNQNNQKSSIDSIKNQIVSILTSINNISTQVSQAYTQINNLNTQLTQTNANVASINTKISQIDTQITLLNTQYNSLLAQLTTILNQLSIPTTLANGLVAYYPFNGNANDLSGNSYNGTVNGVTLTPDRFGNANSAYSFNGKSNYILFPTFSALNNTAQISFSFWINTAVPIAGETIFSQWSSTNIGCGLPVGVNFYLTPTSQIGEGFIGCTPTLNITSGNVVPKNQWTNIVVVYDGTQAVVGQRVVIYVNSTLLGYVGNSGAVPPLTGSLATNAILGCTIGGSQSSDPNNIPFGPGGVGSLYSFFQGNMDDIRIYNRVLSPTEITYLATH